MRLSIRAAGLVSALSAALSLLLWLSAAAADTASANGQHRVLQPGNNPIGWVGAQTTPDALLAQIPSAVLIYAWDAENATYLFDTSALEGTLRVIEPGMGLIVRIDALEPVTWRQPSTAVSRRIDLHPGPNLVAWTSANQTPIDLALAVIDDAAMSASFWDRSEGAMRSFPDSDGGQSASHQLMHGDGLWVFASVSAAWRQAELGRPLHLVGRPDAGVRWSGSFDKYLDSDGLDIFANQETSSESLVRAAELIDNMLTNRPDIRDAMAENRYQTVIVGRSERTYDLAPYQDLEGVYPEAYERGGGPRGLGGSTHYPTLFPEEGLLCLTNDGYRDYSVSVHEFAHTIDDTLTTAPEFADSQPPFRVRLAAAYEQAQTSLLWEQTYAISLAIEFWAEIVTVWMGVYGPDYASRSALAPDPTLISRDGLEEHAPYAAELIEDTLGEVDFTASCKLGAGSSDS